MPRAAGFTPEGAMRLLQGERGQCSMTGCAPFVRPDLQLQMGDALRRNRPFLTLKRRAWWTKGILLAQQCLIGVPPVSRDRHVGFLRTADVPFLALKADPPPRLRGSLCP